MRKNKQKTPVILENLRVEDFAAEGKCLARNDGQVIFIEGEVAPGDLVDVRIFKTKNSFREGRAIAVHEFSNVRQEPRCQHFGTCGGCKWQHIQYETQLDFKTRQVRDSLDRLAKVPHPGILPIIGSAQEYGYRNKLEFTFSSNRWYTDAEIASGDTLERRAAGFHIPKRFDRILDIEKCHLQPEPSNAIRLAIKAYAEDRDWTFYDLIKHQGFIRNVVIRTASTGQVMVIVQFGEPQWEAINELTRYLQETFPMISSLHVVVNEKVNDTFQDQDVIHVSGTPYIEEQMEGLIYRVGPKSFYQTNSDQAYTLYKITRDYAQLKGDELVYDLYTGTGTIANFVARQAAHVVGIEYVPSAVEDAKVNSEINGISNTSFFAGDMKKLLRAEFFFEHGKPDVIITDPPRAGMDADVVEAIIAAAPQRIVYVSCNPATQARDVAMLSELYEVKAVQPVDMFPHTHHVENVMWLEKKAQ
ncbi:23S rRNA (uracil(1939)-C(5))-methyltransferase RlmD [Siphonobacter sp. SORGH_AS_0500]|uniref:23S rRNA (uracil(1939)-C(5))-methyltransferase RlmD n=1 Tax=Siphonobacter sp. SORGH_AS_0500 TaxID=1864824 RepID=UPI000CCA80A2|nr:23S rRNA (uracil(1939)-C(5))-methyltransferase RlmD [Siphonobacter sp. SORGH_AS_0500]MDR6195220.1 23S rRNA (uracil1939-C5)-methyltransferase [Siphonobacter sp. SORGH_AS_0500]PKK38319.1 23S rRNA (uracil(1939)-C(5))-methyltransferase RlmD [Siphonobacter sp. SORGH_AS_0500]